MDVKQSRLHTDRAPRSQTVVGYVTRLGTAICNGLNWLILGRVRSPDSFRRRRVTRNWRVTWAMHAICRHGGFYAHRRLSPDVALGMDVYHIVFVGLGPRQQSSSRGRTGGISHSGTRQLLLPRAIRLMGRLTTGTTRTMLDLRAEDSKRRRRTDASRGSSLWFASAHPPMGDERFLTAAEKGSDYLREHIRAVDTVEDTCYGDHGGSTSTRPRARRCSCSSGLGGRQCRGARAQDALLVRLGM